jgi:hypothetical protein
VAEWRSNGTGKTGMLEATGTVRRWRRDRSLQLAYCNTVIQMPGYRRVNAKDKRLIKITSPQDFLPIQREHVSQNASMRPPDGQVHLTFPNSCSATFSLYQILESCVKLLINFSWTSPRRGRSLDMNNFFNNMDNLMSNRSR